MFLFGVPSFSVCCSLHLKYSLLYKLFLGLLSKGLPYLLTSSSFLAACALSKALSSKGLIQ